MTRTIFKGLIIGDDIQTREQIAEYLEVFRNGNTLVFFAIIIKLLIDIRDDARAK
ncbi:MAG: hypothetical protein KAJ03_09990 [Gammaproteobacteria bacterium]|nr:hypothetical protein [Gammaproteobacteria bacterium]